jgi:hypothetical protein
MNQTFPGLISNLTSNIANLNVSIVNRLENLEYNLTTQLSGMNATFMAELAEVNLTLYIEIQDLLFTLTNDVAEMNSSVASQITNLRADITGDIADFRAWLAMVLDLLDHNISTANQTLHTHLTDLETMTASFHNSMLCDITNLSAQLTTAEGNLSAQNDVTIAEINNAISVLSDLGNSSRELTLSELRYGLLNLARNISEHDAHVSDNLVSLSDDVAAFEDNVTEKLAEIDANLGNLSKLNDIIADITALDVALSEAENQISRDIQSANNEQMAKLDIQLILLIIIIVLVIVSIGVSLSRRKKEEKSLEKNKKDDAEDKGVEVTAIPSAAPPKKLVIKPSKRKPEEIEAVETPEESVEEYPEHAPQRAPVTSDEQDAAPTLLRKGRLTNEENLARLKSAYREGKITQEAYESNLRKLENR